MNDFKISSKLKMIALMFGIAFITYNLVVFVGFGFPNHGACFWISYVFMLIAAATLAVSGYLLKSRDIQPKDWLLGYPVLKHCTIYIILELIASIAFMLLDYKDCPGAIAFVVQIILLTIHLVFIISCFLAKEMIEDIQQNVKTKTSTIKLLQVDVEMIAESAKNTEVKTTVFKFAEQIRYSDPMSSDALADLETQITYLVSQLKNSVTLDNDEEALQICNKASLLLMERNKKCKVLK